MSWLTDSESSYKRSSYDSERAERQLTGEAVMGEMPRNSALLTNVVKNYRPVSLIVCK